MSFPHTPILSYSHILKSYLLRAHTETKSNKWQQYSLFGKKGFRNGMILEQKMRSLQKFTWPGKELQPSEKYAGSSRSSCSKSKRNLWTQDTKSFLNLRPQKVLWTASESRSMCCECIWRGGAATSSPPSQVQVECLNFCPGSYFFPRVSGEKPFFFLQALHFFFQGLPLLIGMSLLGWIPFIKPFPEGFAETATEMWRQRIPRKVVVNSKSCEVMFLKYRVL